ncbi:hypothetical protein FOG50_02477 [Hanseniaspora uvarum]|nr:hypothetical protein FOG50_02477 [Hanseniaspora uvarum]
MNYLNKQDQKHIISLDLMFGGNSNTGTMFGQQPTAQTGGLFGQQNNTTNGTPGTTGGLFGQQQSSTNAPSGGLFGQSNNASTGTSGGLFGQNNSTASTGTSGGLFGQNNNTNTGASGTTGGLFGQNNNTNTGASGGLFGQKNNTTTNTTGGLFGQNNNNTTGSTGGLFGQKSNTNTGTSGGLFGQNNNTNTTTAGGLFGQNSNTNSGTTGGLFGQQNTQTPQNNTNVATEIHSSYLPLLKNLNITPTTRIKELPEEIKNEIKLLNKYLETQLMTSYQIKTEYARHLELIESIPVDLKFLSNLHFEVKETLLLNFKKTNNIRNNIDEIFNDCEIIQLLLQQILIDPVNFLINVEDLEKLMMKSLLKMKNKSNELNELLENLELSMNSLNSQLFNTNDENAANDTNQGLILIMDTVTNEFEAFMKISEIIAQLHQQVKQIKSMRK